MPLLHARSFAHPLVAALGAVALSCAGSQSGAASGASGAGSSGGAATGTVTLEGGRYDQLTTEDRVGTGDRPEPDGQNDVRLAATVSGRVSALILTVCQGEGSPTSAQWDTIVGQEPIPQGFLHRLGVQTWVLGVVDARGRMLNRDNGSLPELGFDRPTQLRLYASTREELTPPRTMCLTVVRPDGSMQWATAEVRAPPE
jgi:hypothetical protein